MRISDKEARILAAVELQADASIQTLQQQTGYRAHTIRYVLQKLEHAGVIRPVPFVDMHPLGYQDFGLYFSLAVPGTKSKKELLNVFRDSPFITFLVELGGDYQYCAGIYAKHINEFISILDELSTGSTQLFFEKSITMRVSMTRFRRKYLCPTLPSRTFSFGGKTESVTIDQTDERILSAMNTSGGLSQRGLATKLGIPFSTLHHRINQLTEKKILCGTTYAIDPGKIGVQAFQLLIYAKGLGSDVQKALYQFAKNHSHIVYIVRCVGAWDVELGVEVERPEQVTELTQELYEAFRQDLVTIKILPVFSFLKYVFFRPSRGYLEAKDPI